MFLRQGCRLSEAQISYTTCTAYTTYTRCRKRCRFSRAEKPTPIPTPVGRSWRVTQNAPQAQIMCHRHNSRRRQAQFIRCASNRCFPSANVSPCPRSPLKGAEPKRAQWASKRGGSPVRARICKPRREAVGRLSPGKPKVCSGCTLAPPQAGARATQAQQSSVLELWIGGTHAVRDERSAPSPRMPSAGKSTPRPSPDGPKPDRFSKSIQRVSAPAE